jgi:hypothetical protein
MRTRPARLAALGLAAALGAGSYAAMTPSADAAARITTDYEVVGEPQIVSNADGTRHVELTVLQRTITERSAAEVRIVNSVHHETIVVDDVANERTVFDVIGATVVRDPATEAQDVVFELMLTTPIVDPATGATGADIKLGFSVPDEH